MKRLPLHKFIGILLACAVLTAQAGFVTGGKAEASEIPEHNGYVFKIADPSALQTENGESLPDGIERVEYTDDLYTAESIGDIKEAVPAGEIDYIEPNYKVRLFDSAAPNDPDYAGKQYNLPGISVPEIWGYGLEGQDMDESVDMDGDGDALNDEIVIAVIDSGLYAEHEDIDPESILPGVSFLGDENGTATEDQKGHGTFVTGIISAVKDNGRGIAGMLQRVKILPICIFSDTESDDTNVVSAIHYAVEQKRLYDSSYGREGANVAVINMSFGSDETFTAMKEACDEAMSEGILIVCAAGNDGNYRATYPAQYSMGVGSVGTTFVLSSFSQKLSIKNGEGFENKLWVTAPGASIYSLGIDSPSYYRYNSGTSFACPHVAALGALCKSIDNTIDQPRFMELLKATSTYVTSNAGDIGGQDILYGWGIIDCGRAVRTLVDEKMNQTEPLPGKISKVQTSGSFAKRQFKVSFSPRSDADSYELAWRVKGGTWNYRTVSADADQGSTLSVTVGALEENAYYQFRVRAIRNVRRSIVNWPQIIGSDDRRIGPWSDTVCRKMSRTSETLAAGKKGSRKITVRWKKVKGTGYYQIQYSRYQDMRSAETVSSGSSKSSRVIKNLKRGKRYYVRIRPMRKIGSHLYTGIWSAKHSATVR